MSTTIIVTHQKLEYANILSSQKRPGKLSTMTLFSQVKEQILHYILILAMVFLLYPWYDSGVIGTSGNHDTSTFHL